MLIYMDDEVPHDYDEHEFLVFLKSKISIFGF